MLLKLIEQQQQHHKLMLLIFCWIEWKGLVNVKSYQIRISSNKNILKKSPKIKNIEIKNESFYYK